MKKRKLSYYVSLYFKIITQDIKSKMSYRSDFIISTIGMIFTNIADLLAFYIIFLNFSSIQGWTYYEMLFLYGFSLISFTPLQCLFDNNWNLRMQVYSGDFIKYCFRPVNIFFYFMSEVFDVKGVGQLLFGIATLIYAWSKLQLDVSFIIIIQLVFLLITSSLFMIAIMNIAAASCFILVNSGYIMVMSSRFRDYAKYPVTVFSPVFRFIFTFIIPIAFVAYYPSLIFIRPDNVPLLTYLSPLLGMLFFWISYKIWMKGARSYSFTGS